jgi:hypothetical protein
MLHSFNISGYHFPGGLLYMNLVHQRKEFPMLQRIIMMTISLVAFSALVARADPKDDIQAALQKLADSPNYSWTTTIEGGFGRGPQEGKTQKDGLTWLSIQMRDNSYEILARDGKVAIKTPDGWKTASEIESSDDGDQPSPDRFAAMIGRNLRTPATQALEWTGKLQNIQKTDDGYTADLPTDAAERLLTFRRRPTTNPDDSNAPQISVKNAKASATFTIKDGELTKMALHTSGTVTFNDNDRDVDRTMTTEFKDVGSTKIDVPADAKAKLGS